MGYDNNLTIALSEEDYRLNKKISWLPEDKLSKESKIRLKLPNGSIKQLKDVWRVKDDYLGHLFRNYIALELTDGCTVKCSDYCSALSKRKNFQNITIDFAREIATAFFLSKPYKPGSDFEYIDNFEYTHVAGAIGGIKTVCITGGEPLLNPNWDKILLQFSLENPYKYWTSMIIVTNLTKYDELFEKIKGLKKQLEINKVLLELQFSYNTPLEREFAKIVRDEDAYKYLKKGIPPLNDYKGYPEDALLETITHAQYESMKNDIYTVTRVTEALNEKELLRKRLWNYPKAHRLDKRAQEEDYKFGLFGTNISIYTKKVAAGYAKNKNDSIEVKVNGSLFHKEIYIMANGGIKPYFIFDGQLGLIGNRL